MLQEVYLHLDSGQRDYEAYPTRAYFKIRLDTPIRDIHSVEVLAMVIPNLDNVLDEPYLILDIYELNGTFAGHPSQQPSTAVLNLQNAVTGPTYSHVALCRKVAERSPIFYRPPKKRLDSVTFALRKPDGTLVNLGSDVGSLIRQNQLLVSLKFMCDQKNPTDLVLDYRRPDA